MSAAPGLPELGPPTSRRPFAPCLRQNHLGGLKGAPCTFIYLLGCTLRSLGWGLLRRGARAVPVPVTPEVMPTPRSLPTDEAGFSPASGDRQRWPLIPRVQILHLLSKLANFPS